MTSFLKGSTGYPLQPAIQVERQRFSEEHQVTVELQDECLILAGGQLEFPYLADDGMSSITGNYI